MLLGLTLTSIDMSAPPTHAEKAAFLQSVLPIVHGRSMHGGALQVPILMGGGLTGLAPAGDADHRIIGYLHPPAPRHRDPPGGDDASMRNLTRQEILAQRLQRPELD